MSMKPDDIPKDVWEAAFAAMPPIIRETYDISPFCMALHLGFARAIMAAEKRGEERELEACACRVDLVADGIAGLPVKSEDVKIASGALVDVLRTLSADFRKRQSELG